MAIKVYVNDNGTPTLVEMAAESAEALAKLVSAGEAQTFTDEEKAQARENIGAFSSGGGAIGGSIISSTNNAIDLTTDGGDAYVATARNSDTGNAVSFGIDVSGVSRGIFDKALDRWLVHFDEDGVLKTNRKTVITETGGTIAGTLALSGKVLQFYTAEQGYANRFHIHHVTDTNSVYFEKFVSGSARSRIIFRTNENGRVDIEANDGTNVAKLFLYADGTLTLNGDNVVVVESWESGANWYRKYSDGWIEQGGQITWTAARNPGTKTVTLNTNFSSTNYHVRLETWRYAGGTFGTSFWGRTTSYFYGWTYGHGDGDSSQGMSWYACGY